ncbi:MAG TPA: hypothetical protein PKA58_05920, partial [Polyangium sp.]|nr:hypothetical protein [Polyangium sp.]
MRTSSRRGMSSGFSYGRTFVSAALSILAVVGAAVFVESCSSDLAGAPCDTVFAGKCGAVCATDFSCPAGQYCGLSGTCTADCAEGAAQCSGNQVCNAVGKCVAGGGTGGAGGEGTGGFFGASSGSGMEADACADVVVKFEKQIPTVMLLIDQSGSMTAAFGNGNRWDVLYDT